MREYQAFLPGMPLSLLIMRLKIFIRYWLPVYLYMGLIYHISAQSKPAVPSFLLWNDKITHFLEYALLGLLLTRALKKEYFSRQKVGIPALSGKLNLTNLKLIALLIAAAYGAGDELHQRFVVGRQADFFDWLVDFYGSAFGSFCIVRKEWSLRRKKSSNQ